MKRETEREKEKENGLKRRLEYEKNLTKEQKIVEGKTERKRSRDNTAFPSLLLN